MRVVIFVQLNSSECVFLSIFLRLTLQIVYILSLRKWIIHWHQIMHSFQEQEEACFLSIILVEWKDLFLVKKHWEFYFWIANELGKIRRSDKIRKFLVEIHLSHSEWLESRSFISWGIEDFANNLQMNKSRREQKISIVYWAREMKRKSENRKNTRNRLFACISSSTAENKNDERYSP